MAKRPVLDPSWIKAKPPSAFEKKLDAIILDSVEFENAGLKEVLSFLATQSKAKDPHKAAVNIVLTDMENQSTITFRCENVSLRKTLELVSEIAGLQMDLEDNVVVLRKTKEKK